MNNLGEDTRKDVQVLLRGSPAHDLFVVRNRLVTYKEKAKIQSFTVGGVCTFLNLVAQWGQQCGLPLTEHSVSILATQDMPFSEAL